MAMDRMQEEIDDFVNGDINERVEAMVRQKVRDSKQRIEENKNNLLDKIKQDLYIENWPMNDRDREATRRFKKLLESYDVSEDTIKRIRQEIRQQILDEMKFKRRYQEERHLDDLQEQQRRYDTEQYNYISNHMLDRWWNEKRAMDSEEKIYTKDIDGIDPNAVVDHYADMSSNTDSKTEVTDGYMDIAKKDLDARATGVERKVDTLNKVKLTSVERDQAYLETLENAYTQGMNSARKSDDEVRRKISLSEVEKATNGVHSSAIDKNIHDIIQKQFTKEEKNDKEKE